MRNTKTVSLMKAISYRIIGSSVTILIAFALTGSGTVSFSLGAIDTVSKLMIFYIHERIWERFSK